MSSGSLVGNVVCVIRLRKGNTACWLLCSPHGIGQDHYHQTAGHGSTQAEEPLSVVQMMKDEEGAVWESGGGEQKGPVCWGDGL